MVRAFAPTEGRAISLEEYLAYVRAEVDVRDLASVEASAPMLAALAGNRTFLVERLHRELLRWESFQEGNEYISQSFYLGGGPGFFVRANVWTPAAEDPALRGTQDRVTFYGVAHDHNFSFLTVGYWGSGYETLLYEVEPGSFRSEIGARAELRFVERTSLPRGKIMLYEASRDVHEQAPPPDLSISLNLMLVPREVNLVDQHYFDLETGRVAEVLGVYTDRQLLLCDLCEAIGNDGTAEALERLGARHPTPRVRRAALRAFGRLGGADAARRQAALDESPLVRALTGDGDEPPP